MGCRQLIARRLPARHKHQSSSCVRRSRPSDPFWPIAGDNSVLTPTARCIEPRTRRRGFTENKWVAPSSWRAHPSSYPDQSRETPVTSEAMNGPGNGAAPLTGARIPGSMFRSPFRTSECPTVRSGLVQPAIRRRLSRASCLLTLVFDPLC